MTPHDFNLAFAQQLSAGLPSPAHNPQFIAWEIMQRDRWRTRILATLALVLWSAATAGMLVLLYGLNRLVMFLRIADKMPWSDAGRSTTQPFSREWETMIWGTSLIHHSIPWIAASVGALMMAAILTVWLVFSSRQATLNRINFSLAQMAEQLRQMNEKSKT